MPIYAYRCATCGHAQDVLQKISDPLLSVCPACGAATYVKQVTAAGFQLKGSGWYVTDFRGDKKPGKSGDAASEAGDKNDNGADKGIEKAASAGSDSASAGDGGGKKSDAAPAAAPSPAPSPAVASSPAPAPAAAPPSSPSGKSGS
ncbi:MAG: FmdB family zinc ribbon protein [Caldimonas sp.]